ncbi:MAG: putative dehydrogenase [Acidimicrobiia bacterium]|nr:putative dehydrogenase [Acidimicrobiia bacterium]
MAGSIAVFGTGYAAQIRAMAARQLGVPIVALGSRSPGGSASRGTALGVPVLAVDALPAGASCVFVCTPPSEHLANAQWALSAGAAVVVEGPMTATLAEADALVELGGRRVGYGENLAYSPVLNRVLGAVAGLGPLTSMEARALQPPPDHRSWRTSVMLEVGIRPLALMLLAASPARATGVRAEMSGLGVAEVATAEITFSSGAKATVEARRGSQELWDLQVSGSTGVVRAELRPVATLEINGEPVSLGGTRSTLHDGGYVEQLRASLADFEAGQRPLMSVEFGRMVLDIAYAAHASAASGGSVVPVPFAGRRDLAAQQAAQA